MRISLSLSLSFWAGYGVVTAFFLFQGIAARRHANDYTDDLVFWDATRKAVPRSAKAHLNYSVMKGARSRTSRIWPTRCSSPGSPFTK